MSFFEENRTALENFRKVSSSVGARADYVQGGGGNTSVKLEGGLMAIKASGYCLKDIDIDKAYAVLDYAALRKFYNETDPKTLADVEKTGSDHAKAAVKAIEGLAQLASIRCSIAMSRTATAYTPTSPPAPRTAARLPKKRSRTRITAGVSFPIPIPARG